MTDHAGFVADSIEELLLSIAEGVREAQEALNELPPVDQFGRPQNGYHLPYLDFDIEVDIQTVEVPVSGGNKVMKRVFKPATRTTDRRDISSKISGRIVSVPPGEGLPVARLIASANQASARQFDIAVRAANTAGEILSGKRLEFNIDMEASARLSAAEGVRLASKRAATRLTEAQVTTDDEGVAATRLSIASNEVRGAVFSIAITLGLTTVSLVVST